MKEEEEKGHRTWVGDRKKRYVYNCVYKVYTLYRN